MRSPASKGCSWFSRSRLADDPLVVSWLKMVVKLLLTCSSVLVKMSFFCPSTSSRRLKTEFFSVLSFSFLSTRVLYSFSAAS